ncbi:hypothetical protein SBADM41S_00981 [Streptomyces badius]
MGVGRVRGGCRGLRIAVGGAARPRAADSRTPAAETRGDILRGIALQRRQVPGPGARPAARRHRLLLGLRTAPRARHDGVRRPYRRLRDRRRGQRARPGRRQRLHDHRPGLGVLPPPGAHVQAPAAPQPLPGGPRRGAAHGPHPARHGRTAPGDRARPGQRPARQDLHPPVARGARPRTVRGQPRGVHRRPGHPEPRARGRRGAPLGVHEQDERSETPPGLGRAHAPAGRGLRSGEGRRRLRGPAGRRPDEPSARR